MWFGGIKPTRSAVPGGWGDLPEALVRQFNKDSMMWVLIWPAKTFWQGVPIKFFLENRERTLNNEDVVEIIMYWLNTKAAYYKDWLPRKWRSTRENKRSNDVYLMRNNSKKRLLLLHLHRDARSMCSFLVGVIDDLWLVTPRHTFHRLLGILLCEIMKCSMKPYVRSLPCQQNTWPR